MLGNNQRMAYEASALEVLLLESTQQQLQHALGKSAKVSIQDAITYSVLVAAEVLESSSTYAEAMPNPHSANQTRLKRHFKHHLVN